MPDLVVSVFKLTSARYRMLPKIEYNYLERDTDVQWHITGGGSRAYTVRFGEGLAAVDAAEIDNQTADSHFMIDRLKGALLLGGKGLFQSESVGRIFLRSIQVQADWTTQLDMPGRQDEEDNTSVYDWIGAFTRHTMLRRAAADAHSALSHQHEAGMFVYRGLEWLVVGESRSWDDLAPDIGVSKEQIRRFKKLANVDYGVRHASRSGKKLRAEIGNYGTWVCGLIDAVNATRARLEPGYEVSSPETVAQAVMVAMPVLAYP